MSDPLPAVLAAFLELLRTARDAKLGALDVAFDRALKDDEAPRLAALRVERRRLLDLPANLTLPGPDGDVRRVLVQQWPADFPPLPRWFADPAGVSRPGKPHVVDLAPPPAAPAPASERERGDG